MPTANAIALQRRQPPALRRRPKDGCRFGGALFGGRKVCPCRGFVPQEVR